MCWSFFTAWKCFGKKNYLKNWKVFKLFSWSDSRKSRKQRKWLHGRCHVVFWWDGIEEQYRYHDPSIYQNPIIDLKDSTYLNSWLYIDDILLKYCISKSWHKNMHGMFIDVYVCTIIKWLLLCRMRYYFNVSDKWCMFVHVFYALRRPLEKFIDQTVQTYIAGEGRNVPAGSRLAPPPNPNGCCSVLPIPP
jgi:hypothetical protein